ncbi:hypothetical protein M7I_8016 [Glarea lozoyensis 74030]|uniref:Uncharacterized protein n=1 Tax=Glarea lozoyensis (strain ATCC 74030 / MF5533) TaxID=1104152 RepID=H0EYV6_GLAL7|nr:hypothetical protein M7I_8016 [Glarea lozoyensis 74030]
MRQGSDNTSSIIFLTVLIVANGYYIMPNGQSSYKLSSTPTHP